MLHHIKFRGEAVLSESELFRVPSLITLLVLAQIFEARLSMHCSEADGLENPCVVIRMM